MANTSATWSVPAFPHPTIYKLEGGNNYLTWLSQFKPFLRNHELMGIVDGTEPCPQQFLINDKGEKTLNPAYATWNKKDQYLLGWINLSLSEKILSTVYGLHISRQVWSALASRFASKSRSHVTNLKSWLQNITQGSKTCIEYLQSAKSLADQLAAVGKSMEDDNLISFIVSGLNPTFNNFVTTFSFITREKGISFDDFQNELLNHEMLLNKQQAVATDPSMFALFSQKLGLRSFNQKGKYSQQFKSKPRHNHELNQFSSNNSAPRNHFTSVPHQSKIESRDAPVNRPPASFNNNFRPPCQICGKSSYQALDCFHRMDYFYQGQHPPSQLVAMVAQSNALHDDQWYADNGANAHITNDLENLSIQQPFHQEATVAVGNGAGLTIENTGSSTLHSSLSKFHLKQILHCPNASANLLSIQRFCQDNSCYFILTSYYFFVKDIRTPAILLEGKSKNELYPLQLKRNSLQRPYIFIAFLGIKTSSLGWHFRLWHPSYDMVSRVINKF
jgi:hypothetical protein